MRPRPRPRPEGPRPRPRPNPRGRGRKVYRYGSVNDSCNYVTYFGYVIKKCQQNRATYKTVRDNYSNSQNYLFTSSQFREPSYTLKIQGFPTACWTSLECRAVYYATTELHIFYGIRLSCRSCALNKSTSHTCLKTFIRLVIQILKQYSNTQPVGEQNVATNLGITSGCVLECCFSSHTCITKLL